jgi:hypothetical protein
MLYDLYLGDPARALAQYERFQALPAGADPQVAKWIAELKTRKPATLAAAPAAAPAPEAPRKEQP